MCSEYLLVSNFLYTIGYTDSRPTDPKLSTKTINLVPRLPTKKKFNLTFKWIEHN